MKKKNKTIWMIIITIIIVSIVTVLTYNIIKKDYFTKLNYEEFFNKWENDDTFVLVISKTECPYCQMYIPKIKKISEEYKINTYYVETDTFTAEESSAFSNLINYNATPTTVFIKNGEELSKATRINGNVSEQKIINKFKSNDFIK